MYNALQLHMDHVTVFISGTCALLCRPHTCLQAFELALEMAGNAQPETTLFLDDSTRNINGAHRAGLKTVLVGRTAMPDVDADLQVGLYCGCAFTHSPAQSACPWVRCFCRDAASS